MDATIMIACASLLVAVGLVIARFMKTNPPEQPPTDIEQPLPDAEKAAALAVDIGFVIVNTQPAIIPPGDGLVDPRPRITAMRAAHKNNWSAFIHYCDSNGEMMRRTIFPIKLEQEQVLARVRNEQRYFRYDRMLSIEVQAYRQDSRDRYRVFHPVGSIKKQADSTAGS